MTDYKKGKARNCWELIYCPPECRTKCIAYTLEGGEDCWFFNDVSTGGPRKKQHIGCLNCPIFKRRLEDYSILKNSHHNKTELLCVLNIDF